MQTSEPLGWLLCSHYGYITASTLLILEGCKNINLSPLWINKGITDIYITSYFEIIC